MGEWALDIAREERCKLVVIIEFGSRSLLMLKKGGQLLHCRSGRHFSGESGM